MDDAPGRVVVLNGASSTGKTSTALALHDLRAAAGEFWFRAGIDDVLAKVSQPWLDLGWPGGPGPHASSGLRIVPSPTGPTTGETPTLSVGRLLRTLLESYQDAVVDLARAGVDVIVDVDPAVTASRIDALISTYA